MGKLDPRRAAACGQEGAQRVRPGHPADLHPLHFAERLVLGGEEGHGHVIAQRLSADSGERLAEAAARIGRHAAQGGITIQGGGAGIGVDHEGRNHLAGIHRGFGRRAIARITVTVLPQSTMGCSVVHRSIPNEEDSRQNVMRPHASAVAADLVRSFRKDSARLRRMAQKVEHADIRAQPGTVPCRPNVRCLILRLEGKPSFHPAYGCTTGNTGWP